VPTVSRTRKVQAAPEEVWRLVNDPERLPDWWPGVRRVEDVSPGAWTNVLYSPRGKTVRADYTLVEARPLRQLVWRQEVEESPFERILSESLTEIALEPDDRGSTRVRLTVRHRPRGFARFGFIQMRLAAARHLEGALDGLESLLAGRGD
jgi:uncharacterized protein YndB with AHSA1/START domain